MVFCGKERNRRGRILGSPYQCFRKGVGAGMGIEQRKNRDAAIADSQNLNTKNMSQLRVLARQYHVAITHTVDGVNKRKNKAKLITDIRSAM